MAPERQTRNGRAFGLPGGSLPSEQKNRKRRRHEDSDEFDNASSSDEDAEFEEDDPAPAKPPRKKNTMSGVVRKRQSMGRRTAYDKPENYPSRDAYNQAQLALGAPRGCVDEVPEDYEAYIKRKKRHALWLTSLLYYRKVAKSRRKPGDLNPEGDDERPVNPRRHEAEALTDPASWPKEPNSNAEAYFDSLNRQSRYLMWVHEPGNWKGPWPPGVEPCMDINEPDPPSLPQRAQPMKPCSNCTDADPKLRCSPWRGWEYDERNRMRHLPDARCEQCKIRDLHKCEVRISHGRVGTGTGRAPGVRRVYSRRTRINRPEAVEVTQAPAQGQVYRFDDGRSDLVQRNDRLEGAIPRAHMDFSCMQCLHATSIPGEIPCSILGPPLMGEPRDQQCRRCQNHGFVCDKSEAWNNALRAESHRAAEQSQGLMNEKWLLQQPLQQPFSFQQPFRQQQGFGFDVQPNFGQPAPPASLQYRQQQQYGFDAPAIQPHPTVPALVPAFATDLTGTLEFPEEVCTFPTYKTSLSLVYARSSELD